MGPPPGRSRTALLPLGAKEAGFHGEMVSISPCRFRDVLPGKAPTALFLLRDVYQAAVSQINPVCMSR